MSPRWKHYSGDVGTANLASGELSVQLRHLANANTSPTLQCIDDNIASDLHYTVCSDSTVDSGW
jgi:hypothetical protein